MHNPHELNINSNRNTKNIKIIKIAVENANLCRKICDMHTLLKYAKMRQHAKYAAISYSRKTGMPSWMSRGIYRNREANLYVCWQKQTCAVLASQYDCHPPRNTRRRQTDHRTWPRDGRKFQQWRWEFPQVRRALTSYLVVLWLLQHTCLTSPHALFINVHAPNVFVVWPTISCFADWSKCSHVTFIIIEWSTRMIYGHVTFTKCKRKIYSTLFLFTWCTSYIISCLLYTSPSPRD